MKLLSILLNRVRTLQEIESLKGKVVIITGAGKGIGYETAKVFASLGCKIAVISRNVNDLQRLEKELELDSQFFYAIAGDVSLPEVVRAFTLAVHEKFGVIDVLINNAGMRFRKEFLDISLEEWRQVIDVNLGSTFLFCQEVGRYMVKQKGGRIINMASIVGTLGLPELTVYAASKGGIISLTKSLALEWSEYNINVNVVAPGFCQTS